LTGAIIKLGTAHVDLVLDASPSMSSSRYVEPAIRGVNEQVQALRETSGSRTLVSLRLFDRLVRPVYEGVDLARVQSLTRAKYDPERGDGTALYDAVHAAIDRLEPEVKEAETALVVIVTDGEGERLEAARRVRARRAGSRPSA
jgi:Mg-chelatase subunit ChlD